MGIGLSQISLAASYYVRPGAGGNGADWARAYSALPSTLVRGATYYLAAGNYPSHSFDDAENGRLPITIRKATITDHGTDIGWNDAYAGQAVFSADWVFHKGYYVIDGGGRNEADWRQIDAYGIKIVIGAATRQNDLIGGVMVPDRVTSITLLNIAMTGPGCAYGQVAGRGVNIASAGAFEIAIGKCLFRNTSVPILTRGVQGMVVEQCWVGPNYPIYDGYHCEGWSDSNSQNVTIRNNRFVDIMNTAFITVLTSVGPLVHNNWSIYGNVFMHDPPNVWNGWGVGNGIIAVINNNTAVGWRVYNNTIVGTRGWFASIDIPGSNNTVINNIWYQLGTNPQGNPTGMGITGADVKGGNWFFLDNGAAINPGARGTNDVLGSGDPFMNWQAGDVRLNPNAFGNLPIDSGMVLPAGFNNVDPAGTLRGADGRCDIGAFERPGHEDLTPPAPPVRLRNTTSTQSRISLAWDPPADSPVLVREYRVFRDGANVGSTAALSFRDSLLQPSTLYHYDVRSVSYADVMSSATAGIDAWTLAPDQEPPTAPNSVRALSVSSIAVALAWDASTDNQGVAGYIVARDGAPVGDVPQTAFEESSLTPSTTYVYEVAAYDDAGNESPSTRLDVRTSESPPLGEGLVAHYTFDEGSGNLLHDSTPNANDGVILEGLEPAWQPGLHGFGLEFNGTSDVVEIPNAPSLQLDQGMTITAWIYPSRLLAGWQHLVAKENDGVTLAYYLAANSGNTNQPWTGFNIEMNWLSTGGGTSVPLYTWTHLASTYDARDLKLYVNGVQVASYYIGRAIERTAGKLHLGGRDGLSEYFSGIMDEVMIFNRALSPSEVRYIYQLMGGPMSSVKTWLCYR
ncbi:hypothetical protein LLG95_02010 [bacterium]|nr:hypothetical protein [bacterium]